MTWEEVDIHLIEANDVWNENRLMVDNTKETLHAFLRQRQYHQQKLLVWRQS